jgi:predicted N-formylglutamate amidohydrolase
MRKKSGVQYDIVCFLGFRRMISRVFYRTYTVLNRLSPLLFDPNRTEEEEECMYHSNVNICVCVRVSVCVCVRPN